MNLRQQISVVLAAAAVALPVPTLAGQAPSGLEEIIVTAQKREESLQETPVAVIAISEEAFIREGVRDLKDISKMSSELEVDFNNDTATVVGIRGVQQTAWSNTDESATAVHVDGAYLANLWGMNALMFDLERVEVLSGPQGTLYGRNAAAGAVNLISRRPGEEFGGNASIEYGDFDLVRVMGGVDMPATETLSFRLAGQSLRRDGYFRNGAEDADQWALRLNTVWTPSDRDELFMSLDYADFGGTGGSSNTYYVPPGIVRTGPEGCVLFVPSDPFDNTCASQRVDTGIVDQQQWGAMLQWEHDFGSALLTLQYKRRDFEGDLKNGLNTSTNPNWEVTDTYEARLNSSGEGTLQWVAGLFYVESENLGYLRNGYNQATGECPCIQGFSPNDIWLESKAVFAQATWTPESLPRLHLTAGARYTMDEKEADIGLWNGGVQIAGAPLGTVVNNGDVTLRYLSRPFNPLYLNGEGEWNKASWRTGISYDITDDSLLYFNVATGFKSGGFAFGISPAYDPETLLAYEFGSKNRFFADRLQVNIAAWFYEYENFETSYSVPLPQPYAISPITNQPITTSTSVTNIGAAELLGATVDVQWLATDSDMLSLSATYIDSEYTNGDLSRINQPNRTGWRFGNSPEWNLIGRYSHTWNLTGGGAVDAGIKAQYVGERLDAERNLGEDLPSYHVVDASLKWTSPGERWDLTAYANNVTDELILRTLARNTATGIITANYGAPRTWGLILGTRF